MEHLTANSFNCCPNPSKRIYPILNLCHKCYCKDWKTKNKDNTKKYNRAYKQEFKEELREQKRLYRKANVKKRVAEMSIRKAMKKQACPKWVNKKAIYEIYENCPEGYNVDHIHPLKNDLVCGLHVPWNLQYLTVSENCTKWNKFDCTYENESWRKD